MAKKKILAVVNVLLIVVILSMAAAVLARRDSSVYRASNDWKKYQSNIAFEYPSEWGSLSCNNKLLRLPGTINGTWRQKDTDKLTIYGVAEGGCVNGHIQFNVSQNSKGCVNASYVQELSNGFYLHLKPLEASDERRVWMIEVKRNGCENQGSPLFDFSFSTPEDDVTGENILKYGGEPRVDRDVLLASQQYKDIKRFAESIH